MPLLLKQMQIFDTYSLRKKCHCLRFCPEHFAPAFRRRENSGQHGDMREAQPLTKGLPTTVGTPFRASAPSRRRPPRRGAESSGSESSSAGAPSGGIPPANSEWLILRRL